MTTADIQVQGLKMLIQINSKTAIYLGFTILKLRRKKPFSRQRYQITKDGNYLGLDFGLSQARQTIDQLHRRH